MPINKALMIIYQFDDVKSSLTRCVIIVQELCNLFTHDDLIFFYLKQLIPQKISFDNYLILK